MIPSLDYRPRNICYLCQACNNGRSKLQSVGRDWAGIARYAEDVANASQGVAIPSEREAMEWWRNRPDDGRQSRYA